MEGDVGDVEKQQRQTIEELRDKLSQAETTAVAKSERALKEAEEVEVPNMVHTHVRLKAVSRLCVIVARHSRKTNARRAHDCCIENQDVQLRLACQERL